jgi:hypothetical protein
MDQIDVEEATITIRRSEMDEDADGDMMDQIDVEIRRSEMDEDQRTSMMLDLWTIMDTPDFTHSLRIHGKSWNRLLNRPRRRLTL